MLGFAINCSAVPSAGADTPDQLAGMMCNTLLYAYVCGTGAVAAVGPAVLI